MTWSSPASSSTVEAWPPPSTPGGSSCVNGAPVVTDGPYAETEEVLAGYTIVECDSFDRATEIAARVSNCPYPAGAPGEFIIDVRPIDESGGGPDV